MSAIRGWLEGLGLSQHADAFEREDIDLDAFRRLSDDDLKELGLTMGPRRKVLGAIDELAPAVEPTAPTVPRGAERRQITVMFCDMVGSTELADRLDPEELRDVMRACQDACAQAIHCYEGDIVRTLGDGLMVYFGYPRGQEGDPSFDPATNKPLPSA